MTHLRRHTNGLTQHWLDDDVADGEAVGQVGVHLNIEVDETRNIRPTRDL